MAAYRQAFGRWGEDLAARYLMRKGYTILARNVRTSYGEIDLIARQECNSGEGEPPAFITVFVEVKTRSTASFGLPEESVDRRKQTHLLSAAQAYLQNHPDLDGDWRVDVIAIQRRRPGEAASLKHFEDALR